MENTALYNRYHRQLILKEFGATAQQKLLDAKVLVVGAGGLGCPALQYLAAAGTGVLGIIDDDVVSISNLHRQILYKTEDVGKSKAITAAELLAKLNPDIRVIPYTERISVQNALELISPFDIIIDGSDNFPTRYLVNDACVLLKKPLVYGAVSRHEGQLAVFNSGDQPVNYRDLFPSPPSPGEVPNCAEAGVLGILPGIIGTMQANETIKWITGTGTLLANRLLTYNAMTNQVYEVQLQQAQETAALIPADATAFKQMDYNWLCGITADISEIDAETFNSLKNRPGTLIIDVRNAGELPAIEEFNHLHIPLPSLTADLSLYNADTLIMVCQSGQRSRKAAQDLSAIFGGEKTILSLRDGLINWKTGVK